MGRPLQEGSRTERLKEAAKAEVRKAIAAGIREDARESEDLVVRDALRNAADKVEGKDFEQEAG